MIVQKVRPIEYIFGLGYYECKSEGALVLQHGMELLMGVHLYTIVMAEWNKTVLQHLQ